MNTILFASALVALTGVAGFADAGVTGECQGVHDVAEVCKYSYSYDFGSVTDSGTGTMVGTAVVAAGTEDGQVSGNGSPYHNTYNDAWVELASGAFIEVRAAQYTDHPTRGSSGTYVVAYDGVLTGDAVKVYEDDQDPVAVCDFIVVPSCVIA